MKPNDAPKFTMYSDLIIIDEAHMFKNLPMYSKIRNVAGINNSESKKSN